jgi:predicted GNAT family acetyltransferase
LRTVTSLRPVVRAAGTSDRPGPVFVLTDAHRGALEQLVDREPLVNAMASARLRAVRSLSPARFGVTPYGIAAGGRLAAAAFHGANLVPIGGDACAWQRLGEHLAATRRECTSIVGRADTVAALWTELSPAWGPARAVRRSQPLLVCDRSDGLVDDRRLQVLNPDQLDQYVPAAAAMFTEELGVSPLSPAAAPGYRRRAEQLLRNGRAFGIADRGGALVFKADIGALTPHTCQIQGVWVRPDLRGRGLGTAGMSAVLTRALRLAPTVSLYVNEFNVPARALYSRLGMRQVAELSTVLF